MTFTQAWGAYAFKELERDLEAVWDLARKATPHAGVFVVGHSYGMMYPKPGTRNRKP
jgi:alpha-beta hydrolase superfamily lysophospholipase